MSGSPYGYLVYKIIGLEPPVPVYFHPTKYRAHWWMKDKNPDDYFLVRCKEESFVRIPWAFKTTWGC